MHLDAPAKHTVRELARHWCGNPLACDTPDGMLRWWILRQENISIDHVITALAWMKRRGIIEEMRAADGRVRYRRAAGDVATRLQRLAAGKDFEDSTNGAMH